MREKLIELLNASFEAQYSKRGLLTAPHTADDLIENGVRLEQKQATKQATSKTSEQFASDKNVGCKWIPVTERLPEMRGDGFANAFLVTDGYFGHLAYFVDGEWFFTENGEMKEPMFYDVTHWMPLPEAPKGE